MMDFLIQGYRDAFRGLGAAAKLFWPLLVLFALSMVLLTTIGNFKVTSNFQTAPLVSLLLFVGMLLSFGYVFVILCQGAVGWHRRLLLGERSHWISPLPSRRALQYALPAFLFVVVMWIALMLYAVFVLPQMAASLLASVQGLNLTTNPTTEQLDAFRRATMPLILAMLACTMIIVAIVVWLGRSWLMAFPHIAVRTGQPPWGAIADRVRPPAGMVAALLATMFLPSVLGTAYQALVPMSVQIMPWAATTVSIINFPLSILSLLCGLSILSIAYRKAGADRVPYEGTGDAAPA